MYNWPNKGVFTIFLLNGGRVVVPLEPDRFRVIVISNTEDALATLPVPMNVISKHREEKFNISIGRLPIMAWVGYFLLVMLHTAIHLLVVMV